MVGIFIRSQIKKIIECGEFAKLLNRTQKTAWESLVAVAHGFLGNQQAEKYVQLGKIRGGQSIFTKGHMRKLN